MFQLVLKNIKIIRNLLTFISEFYNKNLYRLYNIVYIVFLGKIIFDTNCN